MDSADWGSLFRDMGLEGPRKRMRRDAPDIVGGLKDGLHTVEDKAVELEKKAEEVLEPAAEKMHMKSWMLLAIIAGIVVILIGVGIWCA